ncbi:hypothetical protein ACNKHQ_13595 [Shigella flexneri]
MYDPSYYDSKTIMLESWRCAALARGTLENREVDWTQAGPRD